MQDKTDTLAFTYFIRILKIEKYVFKSYVTIIIPCKCMKFADIAI